MPRVEREGEGESVGASALGVATAAGGERVAAPGGGVGVVRREGVDWVFGEEEGNFGEGVDVGEPPGEEGVDMDETVAPPPVGVTVFEGEPEPEGEGEGV